MPKLDENLDEVLADSENSVLGDTLTVQEPKRLRRQARRRRRLYRPVSPLAGGPGLSDLGVSAALVRPTPQALNPPEADDAERYARLLIIPGVPEVLGGAARGAVYGALLGTGSIERRVAGGAAGGALAFPGLRMLGDMAKDHLAEGHGAANHIIEAVVDGVAHVGGAAAAVAAAGGAAQDGVIAGTAAVVGSYLLDWLVGK